MLLELKDINKSYFQGKQEMPVLKNVNFSVEEGEYVAIIGPSGSGKSTLVNNISTIDIPTNGSLYILNQEVKQMSENQLGKFRYQYLGFIFQNYNLLNSLTIYENIMIPLKLIGEDKKVIDEKVHQITKELDIESLLNKYPHECSGGQQQRLCIARALAVQPEVILLDEPTSALDPISTLKIEELLLQLKDQYTIAIVTHNMQQASRIADYTAFFLVGEMVEYGPTKDVFGMPKDKRTEDYITGRFG